ncbi:MAG: maleylacetoacetate isomerase [Sulfurifustaceae bacterium]
MKLHNAFRSSASYRVRIALNLKGLDYEYRPVHLSRNGGEQFTAEFRAMNPQSLVPVLQDGERFLTQSLAIIEYLDETHPQPPLLPREPVARARVRALALAIACDMHPINNLRTLNYLTKQLGVSEDAKNAWYRHWVALGFQALEAQLAGSRETGAFCHGDTPGLADCCLIPQLFNARRFQCDISAYPTLLRIEQNCNALPAFQRAAPGQQPDAEPPLK